MNTQSPWLTYISLIFSTVAIGITAVRFYFDMQDRKKKREDDERKEQREAAEDERKLKQDLEECVSILKTSRDRAELERVVRKARKLAPIPEPTTAPHDAHEADEKPVVDLREERLLVETTYYTNPVTYLPKTLAFEEARRFPADLPKEWRPELVSKILAAMPEKCPEYPDQRQTDPYDPRTLVRFAGDNLRLLMEFHPEDYSDRWKAEPVVELVMSRLKDHWACLIQAIPPLLAPKDELGVPKIADYFLAYSRYDRTGRSEASLLGGTKDYVWALILGVSNHVVTCAAEFDEEHRKRLASCYSEILDKGILDMGEKRWLNPSADKPEHLLAKDFSALSSDLGRSSRVVVELEPFYDPHGYTIFADEMMAKTVRAIGLVAAEDEPGSRKGPTGKMALRLAKAFETYSPAPAHSYRNRLTGEDMTLYPLLDKEFKGDFTLGVELLIKKCGRPDGDEASALLESAKILVPDIVGRLEARELPEK